MGLVWARGPGRSVWAGLGVVGVVGVGEEVGWVEGLARLLLGLWFFLVWGVGLGVGTLGRVAMLGFGGGGR